VPETGLVRRVIRIVNFESVAKIHPSVTDALAAIQR